MLGYGANVVGLLAAKWSAGLDQRATGQKALLELVDTSGFVPLVQG